MKLSVIIPSYNNLAGVLMALNSMRAMQTTDVEYLVQDDASPDVLYPALVPDCVAAVERNELNLGFAGNCNAGAARATGDVLFFLNQDVYAVYNWSDGWDAVLMAAFDEPQVGIVAPRLLFPMGGIQSCGGTFDQLGQPVHKALGWSSVHHPSVSTPGEVEWATGAALAFRRECWAQLGGFDTAYPMYFEDVDACLRARQLGWRVWYEPRCTLVHAVGSTGGSPHFPVSARLFKERWIDSGIVQPGRLAPTARYW